MQNELWNPFPSGAGQFFFLDTLEGGIEEKNRKGDKHRFEERYNQANFTWEDMDVLDF